MRKNKNLKIKDALAFFVIFNLSFLICHTAAEAAGIKTRAIKKDDVKKVSSAIKKGADVNKLHYFDRTALMIAAKFDSAEVAKLLLENGADIDAQDKNGWTALMWAAFRCSVDTAELLISRGANVTMKEKLGYTALMLAEAHKCNEVTKKLKMAREMKDER